MGKMHLLKCWRSSYDLIVSRRKSFEVRKNDRDFRPGDVVLLAEWDPTTELTTGAAVTMHLRTIVQGQWGLPDGLCVFDWDPASLIQSQVMPGQTRVVR